MRNYSHSVPLDVASVGVAVVFLVPIPAPGAIAVPVPIALVDVSSPTVFGVHVVVA